MSYTSEKKFTFSDGERNESAQIAIAEIADASYGLYVWPCAPVLAQHVWQNRLFVKGKNVLELGAGTALPGLVAAKCGANVTLSDCGQYPHCLEHCRQCAALNNFPDLPVVDITWGLISPDMLNLPDIDIILASDCFYDTKDFEDIVMTMSVLLNRNPKAKVWCSYQVRSIDRSIEYFLLQWGLQGTQIPTPSTDSVKCSAPDHTTHEIQLFVITKDKTGQHGEGAVT